MKLLITYCLIFTFSLVASGVSFNAANINTVEFDGNIQMRVGAGIRPAGNTNQSELELDRLLLNVQGDLTPRRSFFVQVEGGREVNRTHSSTSELKGMALRLRQVYIGMEEEWKAGLVPNPWLTHHNQQMGLWKMGLFADSTEQQYGLDTISDLGLSYTHKQQDLTSTVAIFNGSGLGQKEKGVAKDFQFFITYKADKVTLSGAHTVGLYDNLPRKTAKKNRTRIGINADLSPLQIYLFHMFAEDNAVLAKGKFLDAYIAEVQEVIHSRAYGGFLRFRFLKHHSIFQRYVHWDVEKRFKGNELVHQVVGWDYDDGVKWGLSWVQKTFGKLFHKGVSRPDTDESFQLTATLDF